jgi:hypothetical protein
MSHDAVISDTETWCGQLDRKVRLVHEQIAETISATKKTGCDQAFVDQLCAPYYRLLDRIYAEEYPVAKAIESSDLVLQFDGEAVNGRDPRISLIAAVFSNVRRRVGSVAYAIAEVVNPKGTLPKDVDLGLTAYATGSLYLGFSLPDPDAFNEAGEKNLLKEDDPLYRATKEAIHALGVVSQNLDSGASEADLAREIPDPKVRDAALVAVQGIAPTGRLGIQSISVAGRAATGRQFHRLTPELRAVAKERTEKPSMPAATAEFSGVIREIDLDFRRFELRRISTSEVQEIRCIYPEEFSTEAKAAFESQNSVKIIGHVEKSPDGKPRLILITKLEGVRRGPETGRLL